MSLNLDIHNILVIKRMYELRNVKLVAESLGKTSGAISKNLAKLKTQLNDPLFIQTRTGFDPTAFVEANIGNFEKILAYVDLVQHKEFSPANLNSSISIYAHTLFWDRYGGDLYLSLIEEAPNAKFSFLPWGIGPKERMINGEKSVAIHNFDESLPQSVAQKELVYDKAVFFVRNDHPAQDLQTLVKYPMVVLKISGWNDHNKYRMLERLSNIGYHIIPKVEVEYPVMSHNIVRKSDHFGLTTVDNVPEGCRIIDIPKIEGMDINYVMSCRRAQRNDPQTEWLFDKILRAIRNQ
ncbi:LysR family transcriptional regulator [Vibrio inusitatus NBRC 102082]|uniref:LysR family transcriptional regulator n=1 Tax=Vibrio inusitatus NBRC 102082 TaxID=1219070 RepID=A0A4Y3HYG6_9VIBR|nr:LysR family transcriptional regulator [Vibrio inusitatus]GEA52147.1 LysR family transcriptional regulator [Vibrio inusitatus NBRC 102082]